MLPRLWKIFDTPKKIEKNDSPKINTPSPAKSEGSGFFMVDDQTTQDLNAITLAINMPGTESPDDGDVTPRLDFPTRSNSNDISTASPLFTTSHSSPKTNNNFSPSSSQHSPVSIMYQDSEKTFSPFFKGLDTEERKPLTKEYLLGDNNQELFSQPTSTIEQLKDHDSLPTKDNNSQTSWRTICCCNFFYRKTASHVVSDVAHKKNDDVRSPTPALMI
jgi:hypothetical protein